MPRTLSPALQAHFSGTALTLATCLRLARTDGITLGFTSLDQGFVFNGVFYDPVGAASPSALKATSSTGVDTLDVFGLLSSDRISETDIRAGRYDSAEVLLFQVNYQDLTQGSLTLLRARFGEVTLTDGQYKAELHSLSQNLKQAIGHITSLTCRCHRLGDAQCKLNMSGFRHNASVTAANVGSDPKVLGFGDGQASGYYDYGVVQFTSGLNAGLAREVKTSVQQNGGMQIALRQAFPFAIAPGDTAVLEAGCDRLFSTCDAKFSNVPNFHGEPQVPGNDRAIIMARSPA